MCVLRANSACIYAQEAPNGEPGSLLSCNRTRLKRQNAVTERRAWTMRKPEVPQSSPLHVRLTAPQAPRCVCVCVLRANSACIYAQEAPNGEPGSLLSCNRTRLKRQNAVTERRAWTMRKPEVPQSSPLHVRLTAPQAPRCVCVCVLRANSACIYAQEAPNGEPGSLLSCNRTRLKRQNAVTDRRAWTMRKPEVPQSSPLHVRLTAPQAPRCVKIFP